MADVTAIAITGAITVAGWYATYAYAKAREDRTRRLDVLLKFRSRQIEELYGPLLSLIEQVFNVWQVREKVLPAVAHAPEDQSRTREFFWQHYFFPLHQEIGSLLRTKLYLLEEGRVPESFTQYLEHATQEACQHRLRSELGLDTSAVPGRPWPQAFHADVKRTLDRLMEEYQSGLARLR